MNWEPMDIAERLEARGVLRDEMPRLAILAGQIMAHADTILEEGEDVDLARAALNLCVAVDAILCVVPTHADPGPFGVSPRGMVRQAAEKAARRAGLSPGEMDDLLGSFHE